MILYLPEVKRIQEVRELDAGPRGDGVYEVLIDNHMSVGPTMTEEEADKVLHHIWRALSVSVNGKVTRIHVDETLKKVRARKEAE